MYINTHVNTLQTTHQISSILPTFRGDNAVSDVVETASRRKDFHVLDRSIDDVVNGNYYSIISKLKLKKILLHTLPNITTPENFINSGFESSVYKISDKYVLKVPNETSEKNCKWYNVINCPNKRFTKLDFYYGEPIIKCGNIEILKNATPTDNYRCCGLKHNYRATEEEINKYENEFIPYLSSLPQSTYTNFAKELNKLNSISTQENNKKVYYIPDVMNPNNIIIHDGKFKLVDRFEKSYDKNPNNVFMMLEPFLLRYSTEYIADRNNDLYKERQDILKKCLIAAEESGLPLGGNFVGSCQDDDLKKIKELTNVDIKQIIQALQELHHESVSLRVRLDLIDQALP